VPAFGDTEPPADADGTLFQMLRSTASSSNVLGFGGPAHGPLPVVSVDQARHPSALKPLTAFRWFVEYRGRLDSNWLNDVTVALGDTPMAWQPGLCVPHINVPVLMIVSPEDEMVRANPAVTRSIFESLKGSKEWHSIAGGHFGLLYHPSSLFFAACEVQMQFLTRWLDPEDAGTTKASLDRSLQRVATQ